METITQLKIKGMSCGHCATAVGRALRALPGVSTAQVNLEAGRAQVSHGETVSNETLIAAVKSEGFEAERVN